MEAWHFLSADRRLQYPPHTLVEAGQTLTVEITPERPLVLCGWGLHFSERALDALRYAPGPIVCRVVPGGEILTSAGKDKGCASERAIVWMADASATLHEFACWVAGQALEAKRAAGREPDPRSWAAIAARQAWLRGEITTAQLEEAALAAAAVWGAAWVARAAQAEAQAAARTAVRAAAAWALQAAQEERTVARLNEELERRLLALAPGISGEESVREKE